MSDFGRKYTAAKVFAVFGMISLMAATAGVSGRALAEDKPITIYFVGIVGPGDPFHGVIARGAEQAAQDLGVNVVYVFPDKVTLSDYNNKVEQAIAARPDGIVILGIDEKGSEPVARRAHELGIKLAFNPAPSINERPMWTPEDLYISRVGSDEYATGFQAGERLIAAGVDGLTVCANPVPGDATVASRCKGLTDRLAEENIPVREVEIVLDRTQGSELLTTFLRANPEVRAILWTGSDANASARIARSNVGRSDILIGQVDLDPQTLEAVRTGEALFSVDQQPFWRGYIPVLAITHNIRYGMQQANYFLSGPLIVDAQNVDRVIQLTSDGYR